MKMTMDSRVIKVTKVKYYNDGEACVKFVSFIPMYRTWWWPFWRRLRKDGRKVVCSSSGEAKNELLEFFKAKKK